MPAPRSALKRERFKLYLRILALSACIGLAYSVALGLDSRAPVISLLFGVFNSIVIAGSIAGIEIFALREGSSVKRMMQLPFFAVVLLKTLVYGAIITAVVTGAGRSLLLLFSTADRQLAPLNPNAELVTIGFSLAMTGIFVLLLQAASLVGRRTFLNLLRGRYRRPRMERRFFLFVDVVGSTAIAERLGPLEAHKFLAAVFSATAEPVAACRGEIYQYVGDEIVVTWTEAEGKPEARPLRCYFEMQAALAEAAPEFRRRFQAEPGLRAALHLGEVIAGEVGEQRRAIVFHGDVMNTASRLEQATRDAGVRFIASEAAVQALERQPDLAYRDLGELQLRGRQQPIRAFGVELDPG
ncbi:MAG TPA: adenylate/guanylate cyclase domain-containing protein [Burkholderiales bacterium]|nr:adenylate/guanylate cyclase domain-containing protein [Burkholderiales bacterium]